jgi:protein-disulfide isomerase
MKVRFVLWPALALGLVAPAVAEERPAAGAAAPVAIVAGRSIGEAELEEAIGGTLLELRAREYQLRSQALDDLIARELLAREAAARGVGVEALEKAEVADKAQVPEAEAKAFYDANKTRFGGTAEADAMKQIREGLGQRRARERRAAFARDLRARYPVKVLLEPYRVPVEVADAPVRGNPKAPVTVLEFSDFQCPYCGQARPTVTRVRETYGDRVRWVFRHFPLDFHAQARKAGEAAACAGEQGKFWEMHDRLFASQGKLRPADLKEHAAATGLDPAKFGQCLDSGRHADSVERDAEYGARHGVSGTPAFFVNGRPLVGAQPFDAFAQVIDDELGRLGMALPAATPPK